MQKTSVLVNDSCGETIASPSFSTAAAAATTTINTTVTANQNDLHCQTELIDRNMEEACANVSTHDANESKNDGILSEKTKELNAFESGGGDEEHNKMPDSAAKTATPMTMTTSSPASTKSEPATRSKAVVIINAPNVETICDDISSTTQDIKRLKHVQVRSNSTGKLYQSSRRVSFPENDSELVTGYLEPADPWACGKCAMCAMCVWPGVMAYFNASTNVRTDMTNSIQLLNKLIKSNRSQTIFLSPPSFSVQ